MRIPAMVRPSPGVTEQVTIDVDEFEADYLNTVRLAAERAEKGSPERSRLVNELYVFAELKHYLDATMEPVKALAKEAHARSGDPWTSHEAARSMTPETLRDTQAAVLDCLRRFGPMHDELLHEVYGREHVGMGWPQQSVSGLRTRRKELVDGGIVVQTSETALLPSGRRSIVWQAVSG